MVKTDRHWWSPLPLFSTPMRTIYLLALISLLALVGCRKAEEGPTSASGYVRDQVTGQTVGGARVCLLQTARSGNVLSGGASLPVDTVIADAGGAYSLSFRASEDYQYDLQASAPGYLSGSFSSQPTVGITGGRKNKKDVPILPEGYLKVRFLAPNPNPHLRVTLNSYSGPSVQILTDLNGRIATYIDTTVVVTFPGGKSHQLVWAVSPDGTSNHETYTETVFFPARDTADFTIRF